MSVGIKGGSSTANVANVDAGHNLNVTLPTDDARTGKARIVSENDAGAISGAAYLTSPETGDDYRLRVGVDTLLDFETFNYGAQNTGKHTYRNTTMTITWGGAGNFLRTNGGAITTTTTGVSFATQRVFPLMGAAPVYVEARAGFSAAPTTNTTIDLGLFNLSTTNPYAPTDGVYFRANSTGLFGVANYNGTEQTTSVFLASPAVNQIYKLAITISPLEVHFWIDDVLYGTLPTGAGNSAPLVNAAAPFALRHAIVGGAAGSAIQLLVGSYYVSSGDLADRLTMEAQRSAAGQAYQGLSGGTMGSLANYANSTNPTSAAASNTAALVTGLGGQAAANAPAGTATDLIFLSYQNPGGSLSQTARTLFINGVWISAVNMGAAVDKTPTTIMWSLAFGHTAVSLATTEAPTTKAPRRIPLGIQSVPVGAAIGAPYTPDSVYREFTAPVVVHPGEFVAIVGKVIVGTATASQSIWVAAGFDHFFE